MKRKSFLFAMVLALFASCEKNNFESVQDIQPAQPIQNVQERNAVEALVSLLGDKPEYFDYINALVCSDDIEYMEDRVLFRDLFQSSTSGSLNKSVNASFASDFALHIGGGMPLSRTVSEDNTTDADELMAYLSEHNISIYCPFPLEDYAEDNRIPAICSVVSDNLDSLPGVQYHADGTYEDVIVSQAYADEHPVWIVRQEGDYIFDAENARQEAPSMVGSVIDKPIRTVHYEATFVNMYCTSYYSPLAVGDLRINIGCSSQSPVLDLSTNTFKGSIDEIEQHYVPRKYVSWAKKGYDKGWYALNQKISYDWKGSELQKYICAYEFDEGNTLTFTNTFSFQYLKNGITVNDNASISYTMTNKSDLIGKRRMLRNWFFDVAKNGDNTTYWHRENNTNRYTDLSGNYLMKIGNLTLSISLRTYYVDHRPDLPNIGGGSGLIDPDGPGDSQVGTGTIKP